MWKMAISSIASGLSRMETKLMGGGGGGGAAGSLETGSIQEEHLIGGGRPEPISMMIARLIARTMLIITIIVSTVILLSVYLQSKQQCNDNGGLEFVPVPEAMSSEPGGFETENPIRRLPISIRMMGPGASSLMSPGGGGENPGRVNCLIERKTANQIIASEPKKLQTPFGNITTDPRLVHLTGEKLEFSCRTGPDDGKDFGPSDDSEAPKPVIIISRIRGGLRPSEPDPDDDGPTTKSDDDSNNTNATGGNPPQQRRRKRQADLTKECSCHCGC